MVYEQMRFFLPIPQSPLVHFFYCKYLLLKQLLMRDDPSSGNNTGRRGKILFYVILSKSICLNTLAQGIYAALSAAE